jgi:hypothetical protein
MKKDYLLVLLVAMLTAASPLSAQTQTKKPAYCDELPTDYNQTPPARQPLPRFNTTPTPEYKVQVALLRNTHPGDHPFHSKLIARYRPCEEVWVIESRESFTSRAEAVRLQQELINLGYKGAYLIELLGYQ